MADIIAEYDAMICMRRQVPNDEVMKPARSVSDPLEPDCVWGVVLFGFMINTFLVKKGICISDVGNREIPSPARRVTFDMPVMAAPYAAEMEMEKLEKGHPERRGCSLTPAAKEKLRGVIVKTLGGEANYKTFEKCHGGSKGRKACLDEEFTTPELEGMAQTIQQAAIALGCVEKRGQTERRGCGLLSPEAREKILSVIVDTLGEAKSSIFAKCQHNHKGRGVCLSEKFTQAELVAMAKSIQQADISWGCEAAPQN